MLKKRNAQGMSVKIIIVAIIGLIILAIVVMMLSGRLGDFGGKVKLFGDNSKTCGGQGGGLTDKVGESCENGKGEITSSDAIAKGRKCCI